MEKPPENKRRFKNLEDEEPRIIITDADDLLTQTSPESPQVPTTIVETEESKDEDNILEKEYRSGKRSYAKIIKHAFILILVLWLGYIFDHGLLWAGDPKIFDHTPWRYVLQGADLIVVLRLVVTIWKELGKDV